MEDQVGGEKTGGGVRWTERGQETRHLSRRKMKACVSVCASVCVCLRTCVCARVYLIVCGR